MAGRPKKETDARSVFLPPLRVTEAEAARVKADASRAGYGKKVSDYRRQCYFKGAPHPGAEGMSVDDVMRNLADLNRMKAATTQTGFLELYERIIQRHLAVIKPET